MQNKAKRKKNPKTTTLATKVTLEESERLKAAAKSKGITVSELIRRSALGIPIPEHASIERLAKRNKTLHSYLSEVNKIGSNVNQIARYCNQNRRVDLEVLVKLNGIEKALVNLLALLDRGLNDNR